MNHGCPSYQAESPIPVGFLYIYKCKAKHPRATPETGEWAAPCRPPAPQPVLTIGEERLWQLPEEGLEQAADHIEVLPALGMGQRCQAQCPAQSSSVQPSCVCAHHTNLSPVRDLRPGTPSFRWWQWNSPQADPIPAARCPLPAPWPRRPRGAPSTANAQTVLVPPPGQALRAQNGARASPLELPALPSMQCQPPLCSYAPGHPVQPRVHTTILFPTNSKDCVAGGRHRGSLLSQLALGLEASFMS